MILFLLFIVLIAYLFIVFKRAKRYKYNTSNDYLYKLDKDIISNLKLDNNKLELPNNYKEFDSLFLKINLSFNLLSYFLKPYIKIEDTKHFFEYGAQGDRYLNISHIVDSTVQLTLKNISLSNIDATLYGYKNNIDLSKKILILAPHADDAEIAAFGLYKSAKDVTIVTTTIGEYGLCNYCDIYNNDRLKNSLKKAELRTIDALSVPLLGNVEMTNSLTLGYFGGSLKWMSENQDKKASSYVTGFDSINSFRKVSHAKVKLPLEVEPTYDAFLNDLKEIITQIKPDIIITPHPTIDSHQDHKHTTIGLIKAMKSLNFSCKLLLYTNHLELSETYPIGKINSSISLPPNLKEFYFDSVYSFELDSEMQVDKFFTLESIHDLRDSLVFFSIKRALKHLNKLIKRKITGKDNNYFRRSVRANELFFVVEDRNINKLA
jgi:hypothetical protein